MPSSGKLGTVYKPVGPSSPPSLQTAAQPILPAQQQDQQPASDLNILSFPYTPPSASGNVPEGAQSFATTLTSQTGLRRSAASQYGAAPSWMSASQSLFRSSSSAATHAATSICRQSVSLGFGACQASSSHTGWPAAFIIAPDAAARVDSSTTAHTPAATSSHTLSSLGLSEADWMQLKQLQQQEQQQVQQQQSQRQIQRPSLQQLSSSSRHSTLTWGLALGDSFDNRAWVTNSVEPTTAGATAAECGGPEHTDKDTGR